MNELALFAGYGGGILGGKLLGWRTVCAVERDAYAAQVLAQRQNDGLLEAFPIWSDVQSFRADNADCTDVIEGLRAIADSLVISGGFPCQDISAAGKGAGITGERSGMWREFARIIGEIRPAYAFIENSPMLTVRGLDTVLSDLASIFYDATGAIVSARAVGANHKRDRIWIVAKRRDLLSHAEHIGTGRRQQQPQGAEKAATELANTHLLGRDDGQPKIKPAKARLNALGNTSASGENVANTNLQHGERRCESQQPASTCRQAARPTIECRDWWRIEPNVGRVVNGCAFRVERLKALGNAQVPLCAATAFYLLSERLNND